MSELGEKIRRLRKEKNINQEDLGEAIGLKLTTYAAREKKGIFSEGELAKILKKIGVTREVFDKYQIPGKALMEVSVPENLLVIDAKMDVALSALAELLAKANGQSVTGASNDLLKAVKERYDQKTAELSKSTQR